MMKKNNIMRLASILLVAVILTTCAISGTFAKYTTSASASDDARVAKWGVELTVPTESSFDTEYEETNKGITVSSSDSAKIAAPGTAGTALKFTIKGTPEVATKVTVEMTIESEIHVDSYYPIVWTLKQGEQTIATGKLSDIKAALDNYSGKEYAPNVKLDAEFELTWAWAFESGNDTADTVLGDAAVTPSENVVTTIKYTVEFKVEQID